MRWAKRGLRAAISPACRALASPRPRPRPELRPELRRAPRGLHVSCSTKRMLSATPECTPRARALPRAIVQPVSSPPPPVAALTGAAELRNLLAFFAPSWPLQITLPNPKESAMHRSLLETGLLFAASALWNPPDRWWKQVAGLGVIVYPARAILDSVDVMKSRHGSGADSGASAGSADSACACARVHRVHRVHGVHGVHRDEPAGGALTVAGRQRAMLKGDSPTTQQALDYPLGMRGLPLSTLRLTDFGPVAHRRGGAQGSSIELTHRPSARASQHP
jgi:hypothetical protein